MEKGQDFGFMNQAELFHRVHCPLTIPDLYAVRALYRGSGVFHNSWKVFTAPEWTDAEKAISFAHELRDHWQNIDVIRIPGETAKTEKL